MCFEVAGLCDKLGEDLFVSGLILGSVYSARRKSKAVNFLFGQAQLAVWLTHGNKGIFFYNESLKGCFLLV